MNLARMLQRVVKLTIAMAVIARPAGPLVAQAPARAPATAAGSEQAGQATPRASDATTSMTIYNDGRAVIRERRELTLRAGRSEIQFGNVPATIIPESVQLRTFGPQPPRILEQNYQFDLVNAGRLLQKYQDQPIGLVTRDGTLLEGRLLRADANQLILAGQQGIQLIRRDGNVKDIRLARIPVGLSTRPRLVWQVESPRGGDQLSEVLYHAGGFRWQVNYRAVASADFQHLDLAGWATLENQSGKSFPRVLVTLLAGDVHLESRNKNLTKSAVAARRIGDYHAYVISDPVRVANQQKKQVELLRVSRVPLTRVYRYRANYGRRVAVFARFVNSDRVAGLGVPLPGGPFRVYQHDRDGEAQFVGQDRIDHTPKNERVEVRLGFASDLTVSRSLQARRQVGGERWSEQDWRIRLRNHRAEPCTITVDEVLEPRRNHRIKKASHRYSMADHRTLRFTIPLNADSQVDLTYTVYYTW